jgi:hypothetical protein
MKALSSRSQGVSATWVQGVWMKQRSSRCRALIRARRDGGRKLPIRCIGLDRHGLCIQVVARQVCDQQGSDQRRSPRFHQGVGHFRHEEIAMAHGPDHPMREERFKGVGDGARIARRSRCCRHRPRFSIRTAVSPCGWGAVHGEWPRRVRDGITRGRGKSDGARFFRRPNRGLRH